MADRDSWCSDLKIPEYLHTIGRTVDSEFDADEVLFRRFQGTTAAIPIEAFSTSRMSVNRGKWCESPNDVLYSSKTNNHYFDWSVACLAVEDVREGEWHHPNGSITYRLNVVHCPERCMYPHSEVVVLANGEEIDRVKPTTVKLKIRDFLRQKAQQRQDGNHSSP